LIQLKDEKSLAEAGLFCFSKLIAFLLSIASDLFHLIKYFLLDTLDIKI